jgi:uncharacterized protein (DUF697 family)
MSSDERPPSASDSPEKPREELNGVTPPPPAESVDAKREGAKDGADAKTDDAKPAEAAPAEAPKEPEKPKILCRVKARNVIHKYAALGTLVGALPIPVPVSPGLVAIETHLVYWISRAYGEELSYAESAVVASGLGVASEALKVVARSVAGLIPVVGWGVKGVIAGGCIEALGFAAIRHFEKKSPDKMTTV